MSRSRDTRIDVDVPSHVVFVDLVPRANWGHPCVYLLVDPDGEVASYDWDLDGNGSFETAGGTMDDICRVDVYVRNMEDFDAIHAVRRPTKSGCSTCLCPTFS